MAMLQLLRRGKLKKGELIMNYVDDFRRNIKKLRRQIRAKLKKKAKKDREMGFPFHEDNYLATYRLTFPHHNFLIFTKVVKGFHVLVCPDGSRFYFTKFPSEREIEKHVRAWLGALK
jgi:hypothetical protein